MVIVVSILTCAALVGLDQYFKYLVVEYIKPIEYYDVIDDVLRLRYVENTGAVFGSFATHTMLLTVFSVLLLGFTIWFLYNNKSKSKLMNICLLLMISGGIGNIIDRIRLHYVVDYIEPTFVRFAVFNFADCLITVGAFALIGYLLWDIVRDAKKAKLHKTTDAENVEKSEAADGLDNEDICIGDENE
jgi:signal peptidase II